MSISSSGTSSNGPGSATRLFKYYWPVKGGWEGWIQVDLTAFILTAQPTEDILREQHIYENNYKAVDLLLNADQDPDNQIARARRG